MPKVLSDEPTGECDVHGTITWFGSLASCTQTCGIRKERARTKLLVWLQNIFTTWKKIQRNFKSKHKNMHQWAGRQSWHYYPSNTTLPTKEGVQQFFSGVKEARVSISVPREWARSPSRHLERLGRWGKRWHSSRTWMWRGQGKEEGWNPGQNYMGH